MTRVRPRTGGARRRRRGPGSGGLAAAAARPPQCDDAYAAISGIDMALISGRHPRKPTRHDRGAENPQIQTEGTRSRPIDEDVRAIKTLQADLENQGSCAEPRPRTRRAEITRKAATAAYLDDGQHGAADEGGPITRPPATTAIFSEIKPHIEAWPRSATSTSSHLQGARPSTRVRILRGRLARADGTRPQSREPRSGSAAPAAARPPCSRAAASPSPTPHRSSQGAQRHRAPYSSLAR